MPWKLAGKIVEMEGVAEMNLEVTNGPPYCLKGQQLSKAKLEIERDREGDADGHPADQLLTTRQGRFFEGAGAWHQARPLRWLAALPASSSKIAWQR